MLNLGCGKAIYPPPWVNLDRKALPGVDVMMDLEDCEHENLPFEDNQFDIVYASHLLEHISGLLPLMEELHRVTKPGGHLLVRVPHGAHDSAYGDPTHVRYFFKESFQYFGQPSYHLADYGYRGDWMTSELCFIIAESFEGSDLKELQLLLMQCRNVCEEIYADLECVKPIRAQDDSLLETVPIKLLFRAQFDKMFADRKEPKE